MGKTLLFLAAGMGSRYGGFKQLEKFGPGQHSILEYSLYDAYHAGFRHAVGVIRAEHEMAMREMLQPASSFFSFEFVHQNSPALPPEYRPPFSREKPWGSAHALLIASEKLRHQSFVVLNGDDLYGRKGWRDMATLMENHPMDSGLVTYNLHATLSPFGKVSRGICHGENDQLLRIRECGSLQKMNGKIIDCERNECLPDRAAVSMNFWHFQPTIFPLLGKYWQIFCESEASETAEFGIPGVLQHLIECHGLKVFLQPTNATWQGVTYASDRENLERFLCAEIARNHYPPLLWRNESPHFFTENRCQRPQM